jgi:hypothetical protein
VKGPCFPFATGPKTAADPLGGDVSRFPSRETASATSGLFGLENKTKCESFACPKVRATTKVRAKLCQYHSLYHTTQFRSPLTRMTFETDLEPKLADLVHAGFDRLSRHVISCTKVAKSQLVSRNQSTQLIRFERFIWPVRHGSVDSHHSIQRLYQPNVLHLLYTDGRSCPKSSPCRNLSNRNESVKSIPRTMRALRRLFFYSETFRASRCAHDSEPRSWAFPLYCRYA